MSLRRIFGVPFGTAEQHRLSEHYLERWALRLRAEMPAAADATIIAEAVRQITGELDEYLNQIASRSQTLLAVVAIMIAAFLQIGGTSDLVKWLCVAWALVSFSLFYNIWLFFGPTDAYADAVKVYRQTVRLSYRRSLIFNANIAASLVFWASVVGSYAWKSLPAQADRPRPTAAAASSMTARTPQKSDAVSSGPARTPPALGVGARS